MQLSQSLADWCKKMGVHCIASESITSTNDQAKNSITSSPHEICLYVTEHQSQGRGRGNNEWLTPGKNNSLLTSWVFKVNKPPQAITAPVIGLSLYRAVNKSWPTLAWSIKPPNDLLLSKKKVAGLLIEAIQQGDSHFLIIGLGFNILFHPEELPEATHLNSTDGLQGQLKIQEMESFYEHFHKSLLDSLNLISKPELTENSCHELAFATGAKMVKPNGDLIFENYSQSWKDL